MSFVSMDPEPTTIFIKGVKLINSKQMDQIIEEKITGEVVAEPEVRDKIPGVFTGMDSWPDSTNLVCWYCHMLFGGPPWFCPTSVDCAGGIKMGVEGIMHHERCAVAYLRQTYPDYIEYNRRYEMFMYLYTLRTGKRRPVEPAPPIYSMVRYGGTVSEQDWLKNLNMDLDVSK